MRGAGRQQAGRAVGLLAASALLGGCFWGDDPHGETRLVGHFYLSWYADETGRQLIVSDDGTGYNGGVVVGKTVFAAGHNADFILVQQHPDQEGAVRDRLFGRYDPARRDYELANPADTVYLSAEDSVWRRAGRYYHRSNGWNPPDSLRHYTRQTIYHVVDIRPGAAASPDGYRLYSFPDTAGFWAKCRALGVPAALRAVRLPAAEGH